MKICGNCETYSPRGAEYCEYCGELFYKQYRLFPEIMNIFRVRPLSDRIFPAARRAQICGRIDEEIKRVGDIEALLGNVRNAETRRRVEDIVAKIRGYIESLIRCRVDLEFMKQAISLSAVKDEGRDLGSGEILQFCSGVKAEFNASLEGIRSSYRMKSIDEYVGAKERDFEDSIEDLSIGLISSILARTSIVGRDLGGFERDYKSLEDSIESINHEIDRLSAELAL